MTLAALLLTIAIGVGDARVDFDTDVMPVLTKAGCNAGACHGAAAGRGGFHLSLYGSDVAADHGEIVHHLEGRRINLATPTDSLLLQKPTGYTDHGGGERLDSDGEGAEILRRWIETGARRERVRSLVELQMEPTSRVLNSTGDDVQFRVTAFFSDAAHGGTARRDVTRWTVFTAEDSSAVKIDATTGRARVLRRGRHIVVARYLDQVQPIELIIPINGRDVDLANEPRANFIDQYIYDRLETLALPPSEICGDATFLRRASLDLTGSLPTAARVRSFLDDTSADKRQRLVDDLMDSERFVDYWTYKLAKLLRIHTQPRDKNGARAFFAWLRRQVQDDVSWRRMARAMLTATGDSHEIGAANFYRTVSGPREQAEYTSELFMGVRLRCANCHDHPLDRWTQDDYHGLAAIFARIQQGRTVRLSDRGEVTHPRTGEAAIARIPGARFLDSPTDHRGALADWLTSDENAYFARAMVNRIWRSFMGRGLVEPPDDVRATNPATHPELLDQLAQDFIDHGFSMRRTIRLIAMSAAYNRDAVSNEFNSSDDRFYSHAMIRPLEAEVLADAICVVTGVDDRYGDEPLGTRAVTLFDASIPSDTLDILGRCSRKESCETVGNRVEGLSRKLHMINGGLINDKIVENTGRLHRLLQSKRPMPEIVDELYLSSLSRYPTDQESEYWIEQFPLASGSRQRREAGEDFMWSLLTCREFNTNH